MTIPINSDLANRQFIGLAEKVALRYRNEGRFVQGFVRGKLLHDPVYREILERPILPAEGTVVDLGCGRGILLALLTAGNDLYPLDKKPLVFYGIECRIKDAAIAKRTLGPDAFITHADICTAAIPACQAVILLDVLLYLQKAQQKALLQKIADALQPGGVLILREADAGQGLSFMITYAAERFCALARGHWRQRYCYRIKQEWTDLLEQSGFSVVTAPMSQGTPFANFLYVARLGSK